MEEIGELALQADRPESCSMVCAVLAETDVINLISRGVTLPNLLQGILRAMAERYVQLLIAAGARGVVLATGGLAGNAGLVRALQDAAIEMGLEVEIRAHELSALAGALGAALWGDFRARRLATIVVVRSANKTPCSRYSSGAGRSRCQYASCVWAMKLLTARSSIRLA